MNLKEDKVLLRAVEKEDLSFLHVLINDAEIENMVVGWSFPVSMEKQEEWYKNINTPNRITYAIEYEDKIIGLAMITDIDWKNRNANIGIKICNNPQFRKKGIGTITVNLLLKYSFEELGLNMMWTNILDYNIPSQKLFEKCGFTLEGKKRECIYKNNKYNDLLFYCILKREYLGDRND